jgi:frataxin
MSRRSLMPDAEDPKPPKVEDHDQPDHPTQVTTEEFHERADAYLNELVERLEEAQDKDPQIEVEYSVSLLALCLVYREC